MIKTAMRINILLLLSILALWPEHADAQGTVTFDGPPVQPPGTAYLVQSYHEAGLWFIPILGTDGFGRRGSDPKPFWPDNGSAYVAVSLGDSLMFGMVDGSDFRVVSVDLAEWSTDYPQPVRVHFVGYRRDGTMVTADIFSDGIMDGTGPLSDFQTLYFGPEFSGVYKVQIPTMGYALDNLVVAIPEPGAFPLLTLGAGIFCAMRLRKRNSSRNGMIVKGVAHSPAQR